MELLISCESPDILCITETWLTSNIQSSALCLGDYQVFRVDRNFGSDPHGGVLIAIKPNLNPVIHPHSTNNEVVFVNISYFGVSLRLVVAYRSTSMSSTENESFVNFLSNELVNCINFILVGDLNYPHINWEDFSSNNPNENIFLEFVNENCLYQHVQQPTRDNNILDICLSTSEDLVSDTVVHDQFSTSDHSYFTCKLNLMKYNSPPKIIPNFSLANWEMIRVYLSTLDWDVILSRVTCTEAWSIVKHVINYCMDTFVPKKTICSNNSSPWVNRYLKTMIRKKKNKWRSYKRNPSRTNKSVYNNFSKRLKRESHRIKARFETDCFLNKKRSPKYFFNYVNRVTGTKSNSCIPSLEADGILATSDNSKAEALARQYQSVFTIDNDIFPDCDQLIPENSFTNLEVTDADVLDAVKLMNKSCAPGNDGIYPQFIKNVTCFMIKPLRILFNKSLSEGILPADWRQGIIVPIYKNNKRPRSPASYRPVCLTSVICKLLERIIHKYFVAYLELNSIISNEQHGFFKNRSTTTNLIKCLDDWSRALDSCTPVDIIYIDLAKAFDSVSHPKLIYKLKKIGIGDRLLSWFSGFICDRQQCVRVENNLSPFRPVLSGVGQGTILGPLLFNLYINDVTSSVFSCNLKLYADDAKLYAEVPNEECVNLLRNDLARLCSYFETWQLKLNSEKCEIIHLGHRNIGSNYAINGENLESKPTVRDLGITIAADFKMKTHVTQIVRNAFYKLRLLWVGFASRDTNFLVFLYTTYIRPCLEYNTQVFSPYLLGDINKMERVQRSFTKRLNNLSELSYQERLARINIESLEVRRIYFDLVFFFKIVYGLVDLEPSDFFSFNMNPTRGHSLKVNFPYARINVRKYFFINRSIPVWNALPSDVVESSSLSVFKKRLKTVDLSMFCRGRAHTAN